MHFSTAVVLSVLAASSAVSAVPLKWEPTLSGNSALVSRGNVPKQPAYVNIPPKGKRDLSGELELVARGVSGGSSPKDVNKPRIREWAGDDLVARGPGGKPTYVNRPGGKRDDLVEARELADDLELVARFFGDDMELFGRALELEEAVMKRDLEWDLE